MSISDYPAVTFAGIHKLTLLDYPDKTACTLFTRGCNFACPFCHNPSLIAFGSGGEHPQQPGDLTRDDVFDFLKRRQGLLDGVCISGGEPLAHESIFDFVIKVKEMGFLVKIDTNGSYPERLKKLVETAGIDYVAMDIKNALDKYAQTVGIKGYDTAPVEESVLYLLEGRVPYEFRTTVVRGLHEPEDLVSIAHYISDAGRYFLQTFEIQGDGTFASQPGLDAYSDERMLEILNMVRAVLPYTDLRKK